MNSFKKYVKFFSSGHYFPLYISPLTKNIKLPNGEWKNVRVMEVALFDAYKLFVTQYPGIKVSLRNFEMQRPKHIRLKKDGKRLVWACTYHINTDHLQKALSNLLSINNKRIITNNVDLLNKALCNSYKILCIAELSREYREFKKLDELSIENLHCSKKNYDWSSWLHSENPYY